MTTRKREPTKPTVTVVPGDNPPAPDVFAQAIVDIAEATKQLHNSRLTDKTLHLLISHASGVSQRDVKAVLAAMWHLETTYLKPRAK